MSEKNIIRVNKEAGNFVILHKSFLQDPSLSMKAKGLMAYLLSLPDNWKIYIDELVNHFKDGKDAIKRAIKELIEAGYLERRQLRDKKGKFKGYEYILYETKQKKRENNEQGLNSKLEKKNSSPPKTENPLTDNPLTENRTLLNNNDTNNNDTNNNREPSFLNSATQNKKSKRKANLKNKEKKEKEKLAGLVNANSKNIKELREKAVEIWREEFERHTGARFKDYGKLKKLTERWAEYFLELIENNEIDEEQYLFFTRVAVLYHLIADSKIEPAFIFMKPAETFATLLKLKEKNPSLRKKILKKIKEV